MKVIFFGKLKDIAGTRTIEVKNVKNIAELKSIIFQSFPEIKQQTFSIAVNFEIISDDNYQLREGDEIALIPPVSGG